ncbi:MAG: nuclear transport factor 2 family protein [Fischerella thermalis M48_A2018_028]|nr:nuclear transport factor 2 family protein [Fischerella thermalis M58_A2018_009]MBF2060355.1 nuclear transport factor 2 family protein [Fischerella thermalis M66_A2018_004]MBF2068271.1 nuclear transport factor 2 family protein [Fischerella thermalis M48_A2018_028]
MILQWLGITFIILSFWVNMNASAESSIKLDIPTIIYQAKDAWVTLDGDALAQLFTPDGELIVPGHRWQGQAEISEAVSLVAQQSQDIRIDIERMIISGEQAVIEWRYQETEKATNHRKTTDDAIVVDFRDGRIRRWREYFDTKTPSSEV